MEKPKKLSYFDKHSYKIDELQAYNDAIDLYAEYHEEYVASLLNTVLSVKLEVDVLKLKLADLSGGDV